MPAVVSSPSPAIRSWLTKEEAAEYLGVSLRWLRRAMESGVLPYHKRSRLVRFSRRELDDYIAANRVVAD